MYEAFWGLREKPFENSPDPRFLYPSTEHRQAVEELVYAIRAHKGGALLTGDYGCGKTLLIRILLNELQNSGVQAAVINYPKLGGPELLREALYQLGRDVHTNSRLRLTRQFGEVLEENLRNGRHTLLVVDEAQIIESKAVLEELRLLLNYQLNDRFLLTLLLVGQPELRERIAELPQFDQRLGIRAHLHTFDLVDTARYIAYRVSVAGAAKCMFTQDALDVIYQRSFGCPRRINNLGDLCLLKGFREKTTEVNSSLVEAVA